MKDVPLHFTKCHGMGNDFIIMAATDLAAGRIFPPEAARGLCNRRYGAGADGMIFWRLSTDPPGVEARIYNADGSEAESSGNGLRCLAAALFFNRIWVQKSLRVHLGGTTKELQCLRLSEGRFLLSTELGTPRLRPEDIPFADRQVQTPIRDYPFKVKGIELPGTVLSLGNPHLVVRYPDADLNLVTAVGPALENHPLFPARINVCIIQRIEDNSLNVLLWERGVGITPSSGTGSAAAAVAAILNGWASSPVMVSMPGGDILIEWEPGGTVRQEAWAEVVYQGTIFAAAIRSAAEAS
ncbi:MAG: diaminopimelate epimerase [Acidobacteria bacterium]|nr:diaminopimelate epimerase [Acidobacteriota bacterium]